jgi:hypothetical protein
MAGFVHPWTCNYSDVHCRFLNLDWKFHSPQKEWHGERRRTRRHWHWQWPNDITDVIIVVMMILHFCLLQRISHYRQDCLPQPYSSRISWTLEAKLHTLMYVYSVSKERVDLFISSVSLILHHSVSSRWQMLPWQQCNNSLYAQYTLSF